MSQLFMKTSRVLICVYVATFMLLLAANVPWVGEQLLRLQDTRPGLRILFAFMGMVTALTFFILMGYCLYHWGTHPSEGFSKQRWFLVIILLNFLGVLIYYFSVIEREHRAASTT